MIQFPLFAPGYGWGFDADFTYVLSDSGSYVFQSPLYQHMFPLITGKAHTNQICKDGNLKQLAHKFAIIEELAQKGILIEAMNHQSTDKWTAGLADHFPSSQEIPNSQARNENRLICHSSHDNSSTITSALSHAVSTFTCKIDLDVSTVVIANSYHNPVVRRTCQGLLESKVGFLLVKPYGLEIWVGPLFRPSGQCVDCFFNRVKQNNPVDTYIYSKKHNLVVDRLALTEITTAVDVGLSSISNIVDDHDGKEAKTILEQNVFSVNSKDQRVQLHKIHPESLCPRCVRLNKMQKMQVSAFTDQIILAEQNANTHVFSGYRTSSPKDTLSRCNHLVSRITGIVSELEKTYPLDSPDIHNYTSSHYFPGLVQESDMLDMGKKRRSAGKGRTDADAKVGALAEAVERYSGIFTGSEVTIASSYDKPSLPNLVHPNSVLLYSDEQYDNRTAINRLNNKYHHVPDRFNENAIIEWSPLWSLRNSDIKYLPTSLLYYGYNETTCKPFCYADSNGCAAGNCIEEAILQGLYELIERDAVAIWWYNMISVSGLNLADVRDEYVQSVYGHYCNIGRSIWFLDITSDLGVPTYVAVSKLNDQTTDSDQIVFGFGTHCNNYVALIRAITEVNQFLSVVQPDIQNHNKLFQYVDDEARSWLQSAKTSEHSYLTPQSPASLDYNQVFSSSRDRVIQVSEEICRCVSMLASQDLDVLVLNQTRLFTGLNVVRVVVPGLRHFWARFGLGRLYDVPVRMGIRSIPTRESDLNKIPIFF